MTDVALAAIVEGHGECEAVPILVRRIAALIDPGFVPIVRVTLRVPASRLRKQGELERSVELAANKLNGEGGILIIVDCDDGCPAQDGPVLLQRALGARNDLPISVILAKREFEAWFLAAADSLQGYRGLPESLQTPAAPEEIRGAKEWLTERMPRGRPYSETVDQPAFTSQFDMHAARNADSFDKCFRAIDHMLRQLRENAF